MKLLILGLMALGLALIGFGYVSTQRAASADERLGGVLPTILGVGIVVIDLVVAFVWLVARG